MNNLVSISLFQREMGFQTTAGLFLLAIIALVVIVGYIDSRKDKKDGKK